MPKLLDIPNEVLKLPMSQSGSHRLVFQGTNFNNKNRKNAREFAGSVPGSDREEVTGHMAYQLQSQVPYPLHE
jgi:hypothetical protein